MLQPGEPGRAGRYSAGAMVEPDGPLRPRLLFGVIFKTRGLLMLPLVLVMAFSFAWECEVEPLNLGLGIPLFALGWLIRIWSQRHLKYRLRLPVPELATTGPYAVMRNPVYVGNTLILLAVSILCELYWLIPIVLLWCGLVYHLAVVGFEEVRLRKMFGDEYVRYAARVPRWLPSAPGAIISSKHPAGSLHAALLAEWQCGLLLAVPLAKELLIERLPALVHM